MTVVNSTTTCNFELKGMCAAGDNCRVVGGSPMSKASPMSKVAPAKTKKRVRFFDYLVDEGEKKREDVEVCDPRDDSRLVPQRLLEAAESHARGLQAKLERLEDELTRAGETIEILETRLAKANSGATDEPGTTQATPMIDAVATSDVREPQLESADVPASCAYCEDADVELPHWLPCCGARLCRACFVDMVDCGTRTCPTCFVTHNVVEDDDQSGDRVATFKGNADSDDELVWTSCDGSCEDSDGSESGDSSLEDDVDPPEAASHIVAPDDLVEFDCGRPHFESKDHAAGPADSESPSVIPLAAVEMSDMDCALSREQTSYIFKALGRQLRANETSLVRPPARSVV